jgi:hypothetical protein
MSISRWLWLLLLLGVVVAPARAVGQSRGNEDEADKRQRSHRLIEGASRDAEAALAERLGKARALRDARKLAEDILKNPERYQLEQELERLKQKMAEQGKPPDLNDPDMQALIRKVLEQHRQGLANPALQLGERQVDGIRGLLPPPKAAPEQPPAQEDAPLLPPGRRPQPDAAPLPQGPPGGDAPGTPMTEAGVGSSTTMGQGDPDTPVDPRLRFAEQMARLASRMKGLDATLRDSPALNQALRDLSRYRTGDNSDFWADWARRLEGLESWLPQRPIEVSPQRTGAWADRLGAALPKMEWRRVSGGGWNRPAVPQLDRPELGASEGGWFWLLVVFVVAVFAAAFWQIRAWSRRSAEAEALQGWKLGPWPVQPTAVRTREDLVRAFEYLALLCLGPSARNRHHHDLARQLGSGDVALRRSDHPATLVTLPDRRRAARELADLYERARYAPPSDPWPEAAVTAARRDLCSLAGVATA